MRGHDVAAALLAATFSVTGCRAASDARTAHPNVVLVSIDSLRADHVGALGYAKPTTPAIDRVAAEGAVFTRAISSTSWTLPAHAALLTGLADPAHGATTPTSKLGERADTLAEAFAAAGYRTTGFFSGPFLHPAFGFAQGFERYVDCTSYGDVAPGREARALHPRSHQDRTNPSVLWNVLHELAADDARPFFFFIHMWDVHYDLIPPARFAQIFDPDYPDVYDGSDFRHDARVRPGMDERLLAHVIALYDGEIRYTDDTLAMILSTLTTMGIADHTIVVITADHGDEFLDHGGKGHRRSLFQELIRVPLMFRWPDHIARARLDEPVGLADVAPTLLDLAGLPALPYATGRSLAAALRAGSEPQRAPVISELELPAKRLLAIVDGDDKVIVTIPASRGPDADNGGARGMHWRAALYDLAGDAGEKAPQPARASERGRDLIARAEKMVAEAAAVGAEVADDQSADLDSKLHDELRALGYVH